MNGEKRLRTFAMVVCCIAFAMTVWGEMPVLTPADGKNVVEVHDLVDDFIAFTNYSRTAEIVDSLDHAGVQVVLLDRPVKPLPGGRGHDVVGIDNFKAGCDLAEHLCSLGARRICYLARRGMAPLGNRYKGDPGPGPHGWGQASELKTERKEKQ